MKYLFSLLAVAVLFLMSASTASAQNGAFAPYVNAGISGTGSTGSVGLSNPNFRIGGGIESSSTHLLLDLNGQFDSANLSGLKGIASNVGGYTGTFTGSAYFKLGGFLAGGGAFYSNQVVSGQTVIGTIKSISANRNQVRPFVGAGYQFSRDRILVDYVLPGKDTIANAPNLNDHTFLIGNEIFLGHSGLTGHLRFTQNMNVSSSLFNGAGSRATTATLGVGLKLVL
jgi:hypothetical protein